MKTRLNISYGENETGKFIDVMLDINGMYEFDATFWDDGEIYIQGKICHYELDGLLALADEYFGRAGNTRPAQYWAATKAAEAFLG